MKTRTTTIAAIVIALVVGSAAGTIAQTEAEPAYFTATLGEPGAFMPADIGEPDVDGVIRGRGTLLIEQPVRASDPRVSGLLSIRNNVDIHQYAGGAVGVNVNALRIVNDDGAWSGTGTGFFSSGIEGDLSVAIAVLEGEGAYDGMSLILNNGTTEESGETVEVFRGIIVDGQIAPVPAAVATE